MHVVEGGQRLRFDILCKSGVRHVEWARARTARDGTVVPVVFVARSLTLPHLEGLGHGQTLHDPLHFLPFSLFSLVKVLIVQNSALFLPQLHPDVLHFVLDKQLFVVLLLHLSLILLGRISPFLFGHLKFSGQNLDLKLLLLRGVNHRKWLIVKRLVRVSMVLGRGPEAVQ